VVLPLAGVMILVAMLGAYLLTVRIGSGIRISQDNILLESVRGMANHADTLYRRQYQEVNRLAFTVGIPESVSRGEVTVLQDSLEAIARVAELDSVILADERGIEVLGVQRVSLPDVDDYAVNTGTDLATQPLVMAALSGANGTSGFMTTPDGMLLYVSAPLRVNDQIVGAVLAGNDLATVAQTLQGSTLTQIAIYDVNGQLLQTTFELDDTLRRDLTPNITLLQQALNTDGRQVPVNNLMAGGVPYRAAYAPLNVGESTLGTVALLLPDNLPFATVAGRQLAGLMAAGMAGAAVIVAFTVLSLLMVRLEHVQKTARALASGHTGARTHMKPTDEAGTTGAALDAYANRVQQQQDALQQALARHRRETSHLAAVLTALPDGVMVQDNAGRLTFVNDAARALLGASGGSSEDIAHNLHALTGQPPGKALSPGLYALGNPQRVAMGDKVLNGQAAAIITATGERVGTVLVLRDMTEQVRKDQQRERLLSAVEEQVQSPLAELAQAGAFTSAPMQDFTREITSRAVALQKLVVEMRELTVVDAAAVQQAQKPLRVDTLMWTVANEWRQIARAAELDLHVALQVRNLHVLGDERRLRWAMGNILDNAIKYTPPGGAVTLEVNGISKGQALMRVRDNGVGIAPGELPHITTRFYRGNPTTRTGEIIRTPGMGQGLHTAEQIFMAHGGFLRVRSKVGVGTAVFFSLPVTAAESLDMPSVIADFEGETVKLPEDYLPDLKL